MTTLERTPKRIGIIGAGPAGLAALKSILESPEYALGQWVPTVFETSHTVGGVWHSSVSSPLYDSLTTNLPHPLMGFPSFPFPPNTPLFPHADRVQSYLEAYSDTFGLRSHVKFKAHVVDIKWRDPCWEILTENSSEVYRCSLLLVCNGHHNTPRVPSIPGLDSWLSSSRASHSQTYRNPHSIPIPLKDASILVVGSGPSGLDISAELLPLARRVFLSTSTGAPPSPPSQCTIKPRTTSFSSSSTVHFSDGTTENIDYCVLATGYSVTFPFFKNDSNAGFQIVPSLIPSDPPEDSTHSLINTSYSLFPLARHLFGFPGCGFRSHIQGQEQNNLPPPTSIAFLGLLVRVAPLPIVEAQARAALAVFRSSIEPTDSISGVDATSTTNTNDYTRPQIDWVHESNLISTRHLYLTSKFYESQSSPSNSDSPNTPDSNLPLRQFLSHRWHHFEPPDQFAYRDELDDLVSSLSRTDEHKRVRTRNWELLIYLHNLALRRTWRLIEARGEAEEWVRGVGTGASGRSGEEEWVDLMWRVVKWGEEHDDSGELRIAPNDEQKQDVEGVGEI
ncbi:Thiol-specific monooxygenase [Psilocybe cubensis]|uniref:FAD/NAD(P)-binding domain-containing protein n=2 Tax=Psilocybe cubensis TaxID=181762 RepID=A0A8H7XUX8_PSICU|nr:Thiol-specific monooxygenase [Psilocybe cubensis]KAH9478506.1 Thiol-specific monooxygenase [Psilocybe cubensis]